MTTFCESRFTTPALLVAVVLATGAGQARRPAERPRVHQVAIESLAFEPATLQVSRGDRITWTNRDVVPHTVTEADERWDSGEIAPGRTFTWVARSSGPVAYVCRYHPVMTARLQVR